MKSVSPSPRVSHGCALACFVWVFIALAEPLPAADLAAEFLEGLRQRGWHDVALEYLDRAKDDPLATDEFLDRIEFERAATLAALAKEAVEDQRRQDLLKKAATGFQQFAASHSDSSYAIEALSRAAELLNEQALRFLSKADQPFSQAQSEKQRLQVAARETFSEAAQNLETMLASCQRKLKSLPKAADLQNDPQARAASQQLLDWQARGRLRLASISFEKSRTYVQGSDQASKLLAEAAKAFAELSEDYDGTRAGYFCILFEGRCKQAAGDFKAALDSYDNVVGQPTADTKLRTLMARAYRHRAECFTALGKSDEAINECRDWLNDARGDEPRKAEWLAVAFRLAEAYQAKSKDLSSRSEASRLQSDARKLYRNIAKYSGEFQNHAKAALATTDVEIKPLAANSFAEAIAAGQTALGQMNSSKLAAEIAVENNPEAVGDLQEQAVQSKKAALQYFNKSLRLADDETPLEKLLTARYYLCWLYHEDQRLHESAVIGEFLARRYSDSKVAPMAARLALVSNSQLFNEAKRSGKTVDQRQFETQRLAAIAQWIIERWPESDDASTAMNLLINIALGEGRLTEAEQLLEKLPSGQRAAAELSLGGSMWISYLQRTADNSTTSDEEASKWKQRAQELLSSGFENLRQNENPSAKEATAILYFVQLLLAQGESEQAVKVLEDPKVGPLSLVANKTGAKQQPEFARETYKAALRAYVSVDPPMREQAQQTMAALEQVVGDKDDAQRRLTSIYVSLGLQLQRQISELSSAGKTAKASAVAASFEDLLKRVTERVAKRGGGSDWKIRNWIAQTNLQLGKGLRGEDALHYLKQAEKLYREILVEMEKDAQAASNELAVLRVKKGLGDCLQAQQKFKEAFELLSQILAEKPREIEFQRAAAMTLQNWGIEKDNPEKLEYAILGTLPQKNSRNLVWGWIRLADLVERALKKAKQASDNQPANERKAAKFQDLFFEARYNAAKARFHSAQIVGGAKGKKYLQTAKQSVVLMKRLHPDLGGLKWQQAFDDLQKKISNHE